MKEILTDWLWTDYESLSLAGLPIGRRIAVARGSAQQLVAFSPLGASEATIKDLQRLGPIAAFVVPNRVHDLYYDGYFERFPSTPFLAPAAAIADHPSWRLSTIQPSRPELRGFKYLVLAGMPRVQEHVFLHEASRTLLLADSIFNIPKSRAWLSRIMMRIADIGGRPRPSRIFRSMIRSRDDFTLSLREVLTWDFDRIIGGHGDVIEQDGKKVFQNAFRNFLKSA